MRNPILGVEDEYLYGPKKQIVSSMTKCLVDNIEIVISGEE